MSRKSQEKPGADPQDWNPFLRYTSDQMLALFSERRRHQIWRKLWTWLAESERAVGLPISSAQIQELRRKQLTIDYRDVADREKMIRHDVMAHLKSFGAQAKHAAPILHLGATSCDITDNGDLIIIREATKLILEKLVVLIRVLEQFALKTRRLPALGFTHFQVAQPVTIGKRASLWLQDFLMDFEALSFAYERIPFRGLRGATGTQDSFLKLLNGDVEKVKRLEGLFTKKAGFASVFPVTGQTYPRKFDDRVVSTLAGLAISASKMSTDIRLLQNLDEMTEGFLNQQVGSSAMAFKQNPMKSERLASLSRFLMTLPINTGLTAATQWLERTLDDSANRRLVLPQAFFSADAILELAIDIVRNLRINQSVIKKHLSDWLPFLATEGILMEAVKRGGDRQKLHELIRTASIRARDAIREGRPGNLHVELRKFPEFRFLDANVLCAENFTGLASKQVRDFCRTASNKTAYLSRKLKLKAVRVQGLPV